MKKIKEFKLLFDYIRTVKKHTKDIKQHFIENSNNFTYQITDIEYDNVYRIYTVLNFPPNTKENIQIYGYRYMDNETKKFITEFNSQLKKYGLFELVGLSKADQISETSIHIVVEFSLLKTTKIAKNAIIALVLMLLTGIIFLF